MDQLRIILSVVKKHQFWVLSGAMALISLLCWWLATTGLARQFQQRESKINGDFKSVVLQADPPNQKCIKEINDRHDSLKKGVYDAWEILYDEEKMKNPFPTKELGEDFKTQFEKLDFPKKELDLPYRETYRDFIKAYLPKLRTMIDARRPKDEDKPAGGDHPGGAAGLAGPGLGGVGRPGNFGGGPAGMGGGDVEWVGIVEWDETGDYGRLLQRFDWTEAPSTLAVMLGQEDLWVYEALLRVIQKANEGATNPTNATVKRIEALYIGRDAAIAWKDAETAVLSSRQASGAVSSGGPGGPPGGPSGAMSSVPPGGPMGGAMGMMPGGGQAMGAGGAKSGSADAALIDYRYVDDKGQPLPATEAEYPYVKPPYAEFKMMPIRMSLRMDQRCLAKVLVECGNSNMPIEVRRVRILKTQSQPLDLALPTGGGGGGLMSGMGGPGLGGPGMGGSGMGGPPRMPGPTGGGFGGLGHGVGAGTQELEAGSFDIPVEIDAIIYIYNPPDREKLGTGAATAKNPSEPATPAPVTPAPVTPAPATPAPVTPAPVAPAPATPAPAPPAGGAPAPSTAPATPPATPAPATPPGR